MMRKLSILLICLLLCVSLCGCSLVSSLLQRAGLEDLDKKLDAAWNEVGKDIINEFKDDVWREYGFGKSLEWPEDECGSKLPKLRDGKIDYCYVKDKSGFIKAVDISEEEFEAYKEKYSELGYKLTENNASPGSVLKCDGTYVLLSYNEGDLTIYYAPSLSLLEDMLSGNFEPVSN